MTAPAHLDPWKRSQFSLWHIRNGYKWYLGHTELVSCNTSGPANELREGEMTLRAPMPLDAELFNLHIGDGIELRHTCCGRRDDQNNGEQVLQLLISEIDGPIFEMVAGSYTHHDGPATAWANLKGVVGFGPRLTLPPAEDA